MTTTLPPPVADQHIAGREPKRVPYVPALDGLRALAVVAVLLYHADLGWIPGGFLGVEVFFPRPALCTDNAAMIALAGAARLRAGANDGLAVSAEADLPFGAAFEG